MSKVKILGSIPLDPTCSILKHVWAGCNENCSYINKKISATLNVFVWRAFHINNLGRWVFEPLLVRVKLNAFVYDPISNLCTYRNCILCCGCFSIIFGNNTSQRLYASNQYV